MTKSYILLIRLHCNINISWHPSGIFVRYQDRTISSYTIFWHSNTTKACTTVVNLKYGRLHNTAYKTIMKICFLMMLILHLAFSQCK